MRGASRRLATTERAAGCGGTTFLQSGARAAADVHGRGAARSVPARRAVTSVSAVGGMIKLGWRNRRRKLDQAFADRRFDHAADDGFVERPGGFDSHGQGQAEEAPELGQVAAVTGHVDQHKAQSQARSFCPIRIRRVPRPPPWPRTFRSRADGSRQPRPTPRVLPSPPRQSQSRAESRRARGPRRLFHDWCGSSSGASTRRPTSNRTGYPCKERVASGPWRRA